MVSGYRALQEDDGWNPDFDVLVDIREADLKNVTSDGLKTLQRVIAGQMQGLERQPKTAVLASHDAQFGLGRMYEAYTAESPENVQVFRDPQQALSWLGAPADLLE